MRAFLLVFAAVLALSGSPGCGTSGGDSNPAAATGGNAAASGGSAGTAGGDPGGSAAAATPVDVHGKLAVVGTHLVDQSGSPVQLKGPSSMWLNWENDGFAKDPATLTWLRDHWGAQIIRGAMGVNTSDSTDPDYLTNPTEATNRLKAVVDNAIALGMYVIIDWHDGAADQHQSQAISFFTEMAQTYGNVPNVLFETFNEPTTQAWSTVLKPYHTAVVAAIRQYALDSVIILGTRTWSQRPDEAAADPVAGSNLMYTLHFYSCTHGQAIRAYGDAALSAGAPVFVTEWGATASDGGVAPRDGGAAVLCLDEARPWHTWMNTNQISWCAWKLDNCTDLTCYFKSSVTLTQTQGTWTDEMLNGHATFVRGCMQGACP
jgi:endoglucanase